jgi:hypothetical protein
MGAIIESLTTGHITPVTGEQKNPFLTQDGQILRIDKLLPKGKGFTYYLGMGKSFDKQPKPCGTEEYFLLAHDLILRGSW